MEEGTPIKKKYYAGIEGGSTKFTCIIANHPENVHDSIRIPTTFPDETLDKVIAFFKNAQQEIELKAIGIGSFGPLEINKDSPNYGQITKTTKPGWSDFDLVRTLQDAFSLPIAFDTDVNIAALGEYTWGAAQNIDPIIYLTIGTGIGGGGIINGKPLHGLLHPEMGHLLIPFDPQKDPFTGICPFHNNCLEGLASGPAIKARWGQSPKNLPENHPAWKLEAAYIAKGLMNIILTLSPQRIILGGGVMKKPGLIELVREAVQGLLNDYVQHPLIDKNIDQYIVSPGLGEYSGRFGAIALASKINNSGKK